MTVSTTTAKSGPYDGDGVTTGFPVTFQFYDAGDLVVTERVVATAAETVKTLETDYTVTGGYGATGMVVAIAAPPASVQWVITRATPLTQEIDYVENDPFPATSHEEGLDRAAMRLQDLQETLDRVPRFPVSDPASSIGKLPSSIDRAGRYLAFDSTGLPVALSLLSGEHGVSAFMGNLLEVPDAATARSDLGLGSAAIRNTGVSADDVPALQDNGGGVIGFDTLDGRNLTYVGRPASQQVFSSSGTWARPAGVSTVIIEVIGGGGGGGGGTGSNLSGGGGGAGGYASLLLDVSAIASAVVTIGAAGTAGGSGADGGAGGASSWTDGVNTISATGGAGGKNGGAGASAGGSGGAGSGGAINTSGQGGGGGGRSGGIGGKSFYGGGGRSGGTGASDPGTHGSGGGGGGDSNGGASGGAGLIIVREFK